MNDTLMTCTCSFDYLIFMFSRAQAISSGVVTLDKLALDWETFSKLCNNVLLNFRGNQGNIVLFAVIESKCLRGKMESNVPQSSVLLQFWLSQPSNGNGVSNCMRYLLTIFMLYNISTKMWIVGAYGLYSKMWISKNVNRHYVFCTVFNSQMKKNGPR